MDSAAPDERPLPIWLARVEDRLHRWRERRGRRRGLVTTIIPYTGYGAPGWVRVLCRVVLTRGDQAARERAAKVRGWRSFFSIPVHDAHVLVRIDGEDHAVRPDRGGVLDVRLSAQLAPGWHTIGLRTAGTEEVFARVFVVDPAARFGIVSDIDDTVMVTALPRPLLAAWNTFVLDEHARTPVPGMAVLYDRLTREHPGAPIIYLSTGAWNVAPTLRRFLSRNLYPEGAMLLTDWGPTRDRWFRSGQEHKRTSLERLAAEFPELRWLLIGDDGQHDEEIYGTFARAHPANVAAIAIRRLAPAEAVLAGGRSRTDEEVPVPWYSAPHGAGLAKELAGAGLLTE
ncbi:MAG TPA: phosphatase domain-containing protein [Rhodoglobus sp.]|nr:phosphatase domain-containing protein [Rhodoglobus sp.]